MNNRTNVFCNVVVRLYEVTVMFYVCVDNNEVQWKNKGGYITIQCRTSEPNQESLDVKKGIRREVSVFYQWNQLKKETTGDVFKGRLQTHGQFPNIDILIKNLSYADTGPYWCDYPKFDKDSMKTIFAKSSGSVLLVVKGEHHILLLFSLTQTLLTNELCDCFTFL